MSISTPENMRFSWPYATLNDSILSGETQIVGVLPAQIVMKVTFMHEYVSHRNKHERMKSVYDNRPYLR